MRRTALGLALAGLLCACATGDADDYARGCDRAYDACMRDRGDAACEARRTRCLGDAATLRDREIAAEAAYRRFLRGRDGD